MKTIQFKNYQELSDYAAREVISAIKDNPSLVLCMASGHTPELTCELLAEKLKEEKVDYSKITLIGLDEWVGLPPDNEGSCRYFFQQKIVDPLQLPDSQYFFFNGVADNLEAERSKMDQLIAAKGGIDLMLVGIGMNGHIGFNEPGTDFKILSHIIELDETTKSVGQKYFREETALHKGITIGLGHLLNTKKVLLMANGSKKAALIKQTLEGPITPDFPASVMRQHDNGYVLIDEDAGALLDHIKLS